MGSDAALNGTLFAIQQVNGQLRSLHEREARLESREARLESAVQALLKNSEKLLEDSAAGKNRWRLAFGQFVSGLRPRQGKNSAPADREEGGRKAA
jgi:hypothetical protein